MPKRQLSLKQTSSVVPSLWQVLPNWIPSQISLSILLLMKHVSRRSLLHLFLLDFVQKELFWLEIKSNCQQQHSQAIHLKLVIAEVCSKDCQTLVSIKQCSRFNSECTLKSEHFHQNNFMVEQSLITQVSVFVLHQCKFQTLLLCSRTG